MQEIAVVARSALCVRDTKSPCIREHHMRVRECVCLLEHCDFNSQLIPVAFHEHRYSMFHKQVGIVHRNAFEISPGTWQVQSSGSEQSITSIPCIISPVPHNNEIDMLKQLMRIEHTVCKHNTPHSSATALSPSLPATVRHAPRAALRRVRRESLSTPLALAPTASAANRRRPLRLATQASAKSTKEHARCPRAVSSL